MYLLDTNVLSEVIRRRPDLQVLRRLFSTDPTALFASEMTRYELRYGAALHPRGAELWRKIGSEILPLPTWLPIDDLVATGAGTLRASLQRRGKPLDVQDAFLAATATARGLVLVTRNVRHFEQVPGVEVENWFAA